MFFSFQRNSRYLCQTLIRNVDLYIYIYIDQRYRSKLDNDYFGETKKIPLSAIFRLYHGIHIYIQMNTYVYYFTLFLILLIPVVTTPQGQDGIQNVRA